MESYFERYKRQMLMDNFGKESQKKLRNSTAFIGGIGGLGGTTAAYLAMAGIGKMVVAHYGSLTQTNMNRQLLMDCTYIGKPRIEIALNSLHRLNPDLKLEMYNERLMPENTPNLIKGCDIAISARPTMHERRTLNAACVNAGIPMIEAAMDSMKGYLFSVIPHKTACLDCMIEKEADGWEEFGFGVLGAVSGTIGCLAAVEAVKILTGFGKPLDDKMFFMDFDDYRTRHIRLKRNPKCRTCGKAD